MLQSGAFPAQHKGWSKGKVWAVVIGVFLLLAAIGSALGPVDPNADPTGTIGRGDGGGGGAPEPEPEPKFRGKVVSFFAENPAALRVVWDVKNTGDAAGEADCTVRGHDASLTYSGFDIFIEIGPIRPGKSERFNGVITIENEGAGFVTEATAKCEPTE